MPSSATVTGVEVDRDVNIIDSTINNSVVSQGDGRGGEQELRKRRRDKFMGLPAPTRLKFELRMPARVERDECWAEYLAEKGCDVSSKEKMVVKTIDVSRYIAQYLENECRVRCHISEGESLGDAIDLVFKDGIVIEAFKAAGICGADSRNRDRRYWIVLDLVFDWAYGPSMFYYLKHRAGRQERLVVSDQLCHGDLFDDLAEVPEPSHFELL